MSDEQLFNQLASWNGKDMNYVKALYDANYLDPLFFHKVIAAFKTIGSTRDAGSWIIKHHYDNNRSLEDHAVLDMLESAGDIESWPARLHILQILDKVELTEDVQQPVYSLVKNSLNDNNKFVRAWALEGYYQLSRYLPDLRNELTILCQNAMETESASVKVRARKILARLKG